MVTEPSAIYMLKTARDGDALEIIRTIKVVHDDGENFIIMVTDRDYLDDPSGQTQTIVFRESRHSIDIAEAEMKKWVTSSLSDGFVQNPYSEGHLPRY